MTDRKAFQALCLTHLEEVGKQRPGIHRHERVIGRSGGWGRRKGAVREIAIFFKLNEKLATVSGC